MRTLALKLLLTALSFLIRQYNYFVGIGKEDQFENRAAHASIAPSKLSLSTRKMRAKNQKRHNVVR